MSMTLADKWSALFHNVLQLEDRVTADIAWDAWLLIDALCDTWRRAQEQDGYEPDSIVTAQARKVLDALRAKSQANPVMEPWPIAILQIWELKPPFHASAGSLLKADWDTFKGLATRKAVPVSDASGSACLWVIAAAEPLRKAWQHVCDVLLAGTRWQVHAVADIGLVPVPHSGHKAVIIMGSPWDAEAQTPLVAQWRSRRQDNARADLLYVHDVASAMAIIT